MNRGSRRSCIFAAVLAGLLTIPPANADDVPDSTTRFVHELQQPGRVMFHDRIPVGRVDLAAAPAGKRKAKTPVDALAVVVETAFSPGDTVRFFALSLAVERGGQSVAMAILDADEVQPLWTACAYFLKTSADLAGTQRTDTRLLFRSRTGFDLHFRQQAADQQFVLRIPAAEGGNSERQITQDALSAMKDLLDLALFELRRQGAVIVPAAK